MPIVTEFTIQVEDRPGTLGKICRALADRDVNIVAFEAFAAEYGKSMIRLVTDNPTTTKTILDSEDVTTTAEMQVAQAQLSHKPGSLAQAAAKLGEANININYAYAGVMPVTNAPVVIFAVAEVGYAARLLDEAAAMAA
jgi:hypothetical protein